MAGFRTRDVPGDSPMLNRLSNRCAVPNYIKTSKKKISSSMNKSPERKKKKLMLSICKSESTKSSRRLLYLVPLKHSISERTKAKETLLLPKKLRMSNFLPSYLRSAP